MAKSKYEYVKEFENHERCLPGCWIIVRVDGKGFKKFTEKHNFEKPNDSRGLQLMNSCAKAVMEEFVDIIVAFGHSDEYSFVFQKNTDIYRRRAFKILTGVCSSFTSNYVYEWQKYFPKQPLLFPPSFDARVVLYPNDRTLRDYLSWRQADVHINNLYNTCFWNLVNGKKLSNQEAQDKLSGTVSSEKHELLFSEFGINYNNEPEEFRKGTTIIRKHRKKADFTEYTGDIIQQKFWDENPHLLNHSKKKSSKTSENEGN